MGNVLPVQSIRTNSEEETFQRDRAIANGTKPSINGSTTEMKRTHISMFPTLSTQTQSCVLEEMSQVAFAEVRDAAELEIIGRLTDTFISSEKLAVQLQPSASHD